MAVTLSSLAGAGAQFFDNNGVPLAGGLIYTYLAGTSTPAATYTSSTGSIAHANPIVLDAAGRIAAGEVWLTSGVDYKFIVQTSLFVQLGSYDNIPSINDFTSIYAALANTTNVALGDALIGFKQSNSSGALGGAVGRTVHQKLQETVSVKDFGAVGDGVTDDTAAIQSALNYLKSKDGGTLLIPAGTYKLSSSLNLYTKLYPAAGWFNLVIQGEGTNTILNFSTSTAGPGLAIYGWGGRLELGNFKLINAFEDGIAVNHQEVRGGANYISRINFHDIVIENCGRHGMSMTNTYMAEFSNIESRNNQQQGFQLNGNHTSLLFTRCWAGGDATFPDGGNKGSGWFINGVIYSTFDSCAADWSGSVGWEISNTASTNLLNCGSESNQQEGFIVKTGNANRTNVAVADIYGLAFNGCFGFNNSKQTINLYANAVGILTADGRPAAVSLENCYSLNSDGSTIAFVFNGASGEITTNESMNFYTGGTVSVTGSVFRNNNFVASRSIIANLSVDQSIPNNVDTVLATSNDFSNSLGATIVSNSVVIPANVSKIKVVGNCYWDSNATGVRILRVLINNLVAYGGGSTRTNGSGINEQNVSSAMLSVSPGDTVSLSVFQNSGAPLSIIKNSQTFLSVEAYS